MPHFTSATSPKYSFLDGPKNVTDLWLTKYGGGPENVAGLGDKKIRNAQFLSVDKSHTHNYCYVYYFARSL